MKVFGILTSLFAGSLAGIVQNPDGYSTLPPPLVGYTSPSPPETPGNTPPAPTATPGFRYTPGPTPAPPATPGYTAPPGYGGTTPAPAGGYGYGQQNCKTYYETIQVDFLKQYATLHTVQADGNTLYRCSISKIVILMSRGEFLKNG
jgi:hypothetical protein